MLLQLAFDVAKDALAQFVEILRRHVAAQLVEWGLERDAVVRELGIGAHVRAVDAQASAHERGFDNDVSEDEASELLFLHAVRLAKTRGESSVAGCFARARRYKGACDVHRSSSISTAGHMRKSVNDETIEGD